MARIRSATRCSRAARIPSLVPGHATVQCELIMRWDEFLDTADRLPAGISEGDWRSSISRAYYAVFHYFREFLLAEGLDLGKAGVVHQNLKTGLLYCGIGSVKPIGMEVERLLESRSRADYNFATSVLQSDAQD